MTTTLLASNVVSLFGCELPCNDDDDDDDDDNDFSLRMDREGIEHMPLPFSQSAGGSDGGLHNN